MPITLHALALPRSGIALAATLVLALNAGAAQATALFEALLNSQLTITGYSDAAGNTLASSPAGLFIAADALVLSQDSDASGDAFADADGLAQVLALDPLDLTENDGLELEATVFGDALAPPTALAFAETLTEGNVFLDNRSTQGVFVTFLLDWFFDLEATVDRPASEFAEASFGLRVFDTSTSHLNVVEFLDTDTGGGARSGGDFLDFSVFVPAGGFNTLVVETDAFGQAGALAVPAPTPLALLALGLIGLGVGRVPRRSPAALA